MKRILMTIAALAAIALPASAQYTTNNIVQFSQNVKFTDVDGTQVGAASTNSLNSTNWIDLLQTKTITFWLLGAGGNASASGNASVAFSGSPDGTNWTPRLTNYVITVKMSGTNAVMTNAVMDVSGFRFLKPLQTENTDASYAFKTPLVLSVAR